MLFDGFFSRLEWFEIIYKGVAKDIIESDLVVENRIIVYIFFWFWFSGLFFFNGLRLSSRLFLSGLRLSDLLLLRLLVFQRFRFRFL